MSDLKTSRLVVYVDEFVGKSAPATTASNAGGGSPPLLQSLALSEGNGSVAAAAWSTHFAVFATPWDEIPVTTLATFRCAPAPDASGSSSSSGSLSQDVPACIQFVPGSSRALAYTSPLLLGKVIVFDYRLSTVTRSVGLPQMIRSMHLAAGGSMAMGGTVGSVFLVDGESGRWSELTGHRSPVSAVQFTADGGTLVSAAGGSLLVWEVQGHFAASGEQQRDSKILNPPLLGGALARE